MKFNKVAHEFLERSGKRSGRGFFLELVFQERRFFRYIDQAQGFGPRVGANPMRRELERIIESIRWRDFEFQVSEYIDAVLIAEYIRRKMK